MIFLERATVNQTSVGTVLKATLGKLWGDGVELIIMGFPERVDTPWIELNAVGMRVQVLLVFLLLSRKYNLSSLLWNILCLCLD